MEKKKPTEGKSMLDQLPPRMAFWSGVVLSGGVLFALGFVILLVMMFKGVAMTSPDSDGKTSLFGGKDKVEDVVDANNKNTAVAKPDTVAQPQAAGSVNLDELTNVRGEGELTIVEFSDPECPFCKRFHGTMQEVLGDYDGKVRWAYKHFPLTSLHRKAEREAVALECAAEQDKFWDYADELYDRTPSNDGLADDELFSMADDLGLDRGQFDDCLESDKYLDKVRAEASEAQKLGGTGTPFSVLVDNEGNILEALPGALPYATVSQLLDENL